MLKLHQQISFILLGWQLALCCACSLDSRSSQGQAQRLESELLAAREQLAQLSDSAEELEQSKQALASTQGQIEIFRLASPLAVAGRVPPGLFGAWVAVVMSCRCGT